MVIKFNIKNQKIICDKTIVVEKSKNYLTGKFDFQTPDWNDCEKTAYFKNSSTGAEDSRLLVDNECNIPTSVTNSTGYVEVSVHGVKDDTVITSGVCEFLATRTMSNENNIPNEDLTLYEQLLSEIGNKVPKNGWQPDKYLGTDENGNVVEKEAPEGTGGNPQKGEDGGYYTPKVEQTSEDTVNFAFSPSKNNMNTVSPVSIKLPRGKDGVDGTNGTNGKDGKDGVGIQSVEQTTTSTEDGGENVVTVTLTNGQKSTFTVRNGSKGNPGTGGGGDIDLSDYATKEEVEELEQEIDDQQVQIEEIQKAIGFVSGGSSSGGSTNIFDKDVTEGYSLQLYAGKTINDTEVKSGRSLWNKILQVKAGDTLYYTNSWIIIGFYNSDGVYVSKVNDANYYCIVPQGVTQCRIAINSANLDTFMLSINKELPDEYEPYEPNVEDTLVLNDLSKVPEELAKIKEKVFPSDLRVILVSDVHIHSENMMLDNYGGVTHSERMKILVDALNAEHRRRPIDCVIFLGDYTLGTSTDDVIYFAKHFLPQLEMPVHCFPGDHEVINNERWKEIFGTSRQYTVNVKGYSFIFLDGYRDVTNVTDTGVVAMSEFDQNYCNTELTKSINAGLIPILMAHFDAYLYNAESSFREEIREKALCAFTSHSHNFTPDDFGYGWLMYQTGNFSYPNGANYNNFGANAENRWSFRNCEMIDKKLVTYMIYPTQTLTIPEVNDGNIKTYDYTKDDDNAYGTFAIIKDFNV